MNHKQLQEVVAHLQRQRECFWNALLQMAALSLRPCVRSLTERREDVAHIQAGLHARLGCPVTEELAEFLWERFSAENMSRWWLVDAGNLDLCARWILQEVYLAALRQAGGPVEGP